MAGSYAGYRDGIRNAARWGMVAAGSVLLLAACGGGGGEAPPPPEKPLALLAGNADGPGSADGTGTAARLNSPRGVAVDSQGTLYIADTDNMTVRKMTPGGVVTTIAGLAGMQGYTDGAGRAARFGYSFDVAVDAAGNLYVADGWCAIRKVTPAGLVSTLAGSILQCGGADGTGSAASFRYPFGIAVDASGNVYVADRLGHTIRKITPAGVVTTLAGTYNTPGSADGQGAAARFNNPYDVTVDAAGIVYVADTANSTIRRITADGAVTTLAGLAGSYGNVDGSGANARFDGPSSIGADSAGNLYVGDSFTLRKVTPAGAVTTIAGAARQQGSADGTGAQARFGSVAGVAVDSAGNVLIADSINDSIRKVTPAAVVTTIAGKPSVWGHADGTGTAATFNMPAGVAADAVGNAFVAEVFNPMVRKVTKDGVVTTFAGSPSFRGVVDGTGSAARFLQPRAIAADSASNLYVADEHTIRKITPTAVVTTIAGAAGAAGSTDGDISVARFNSPQGVAADAAGNVYVVDTYNHIIRKITGNIVSTLAGTAGLQGSADGSGASARFSYPAGIVVDGNGTIYVADGAHQIRRITPAGVVTTIAGSASNAGSADGTGAAASFYWPTGLTVDGNGNVYVADAGNSLIRKMTPAGVVTTVVGEALVATFVEGPLPGRIAYPRAIALAGNRLYFTTNNGVARVINVP